MAQKGPNWRLKTHITVKTGYGTERTELMAENPHHSEHWLWHRKDRTDGWKTTPQWTLVMARKGPNWWLKTHITVNTGYGTERTETTAENNRHHSGHMPVDNGTVDNGYGTERTETMTENIQYHSGRMPVDNGYGTERTELMAEKPHHNGQWHRKDRNDVWKQPTPQWTHASGQWLWTKRTELIAENNLHHSGHMSVDNDYDTKGPNWWLKITYITMDTCRWTMAMAQKGPDWWLKRTYITVETCRWTMGMAQKGQNWWLKTHTTVETGTKRTELTAENNPHHSGHMPVDNGYGTERTELTAENNTSAIWQQAAHTTYQLSSHSCSTRAIQKEPNS